MYRSFLRIGVLVSTVTLLFDGGFIAPASKYLSYETQQYLASVGSNVLASVPPNEINTLTAQIAKQQKELDAREAALREREIEARTFGSSSSETYSTYIMSAVLFILTFLLVLNFVMDWARVKKYKYESRIA